MKDGMGRFAVGLALGVPLALALAACQSMDGGRAPALSVVPAEGVRHGLPRPEALYAVGRYYQGQMHYDKAVAAYRSLLDDYPAHAEARNALGLTLAAQGRIDGAIGEFERAATHAPDSAKILNNLGYAYLLKGNFVQAIATLTTAAQMDPTNPRVLENLNTALANAGMEKPQNPHEVGSRVEAPTPSTSEAAAGMRLVPVAPNVFALASSSVASARKDMAGALAAKAASASSASDTPSMGARKNVRIEIANVNGVSRLAHQTSRYLETLGYAEPRLTNAPPYRLRTTVIQYRPGFEPQARELQRALPAGVSLVPSTFLRWDVQLRLALGKDLRSAADLAVREAPTPPPTLAGL